MGLKDVVHTAQVDETRARVYLAEGRNAEAEKVVRAAVQTLEKGGEQSLLAEALTTHGITLARIGRQQHAQLMLQRAVEVAERAGDLEGAGQAALTLIEELGEDLLSGELSTAYERAADLLAKSQHPGILARLCECARKVVHLTAVRPVPATWVGFSFKREVRRYERRLIERALKDADGVVSRASHLLGFKHYQTLIALLNGRHRNLLHARTPAVPRRRSVARHQTAAPTCAEATADAETRPVKILHLEDNKLVANTVKEALELEGWCVDICEDGATALRKIKSGAHYDTIIVDNDLPNVSGLELVRQARKLAHRQNTPIVMFSAHDCEAEARRAGADAFLRKPEDILAVTGTVTQLLASPSRK